MSTFNLFVVAFLAFFSVAYSGSPCPLGTSIIPCKCFKIDGDTVIDCVYHDPELLKIAFDTISAKGMIVDVFQVKSTRLNVVSANFFQSMMVRKANMYADRWSSIDAGAFKGQENSLADLVIEESLLTEVPIEAISILKQLERFAMVNSEVAHIQANAFDTLGSEKTLNYLDLSGNYIKTIGDGAFAKLTALKTLLVSSNKITNLQSGVLPPQNKIERFDIGSNRLERIPGDIKTLPVESLVDLTNNKIQSVFGTELRTIVVNKLRVNMTFNPLKCSCAMRILTIAGQPHLYGSCTDRIDGSLKTLSELTASEFMGCGNNFLLQEYSLRSMLN